MHKNISHILITGGAGYIGSHICQILTKKTNFNLLILDNLSSGNKYLVNKNCKFIKGDINNHKFLEKIFINYKIDSVIHLAAKMILGNSFKDKKNFFMTNAKSTKKICKLCIKYSVKNLIFSSSAAVYGNRSGAISENSKKKPISPYGLSKLNAEKEIKNICKNKINYAILRFFNVAGADYKNNLGLIKNNGSIFKNFSKSFLNKNNKIKIYGNNYKNSFDGTAIRDYINVLDISAIVLKSLTLLKKNKKSFILNCGSGTKTSILELVNTFKKISNTNCELNYLDKRIGDIEISIAKIYKLKKILKFDPIKSKSKLTQLVKASLAWEKKILKKTFF